MDFMPAFWDLLDQQSERGVIYSSTMVFSELADGDDKLALWAKERKDTGMFVEPNGTVQLELGRIADYVKNNYPENNVKEFLAKADPWVIAHARVNSDTVVTQEAFVSQHSQKVKIPNVCGHFNVPYVNTWDMLRSLNVKFTLA